MNVACEVCVFVFVILLWITQLLCLSSSPEKTAIRSRRQETSIKIVSTMSTVSLRPLAGRMCSSINVVCMYGFCRQEEGLCVCDSAYTGHLCESTLALSDESSTDNGAMVPSTVSDSSITTLRDLDSRTCVPGFVCTHGVCVVGTFSCDCDDGWSGTFCDQQTCPLLCGLHADCVIRSTGYACVDKTTTAPTTFQKSTISAKFAHACNDNYFKHALEERQCLQTYVCEYGVCNKEALPERVECTCDDGATGLFCQDKCCFDCGDRGKCSVFQNGTEYCECDWGISGRFCNETATLNVCQNKRQLSERKCFPGFVCVYGYCKEGFFKCVCDEGVTGDFCDYRCCLDCGVHGECAFWSSFGTEYCNCDWGWTGQSCEVRKPEPSISTTSTPAVLLIQERSDIRCDGTSISVFVPHHLLPSHHNVTWRDPSCPVTDNGTHYIDTVGLTQCGTTVQFNNDSVIFENELMVHKNPQSHPVGQVYFGDNDQISVPVKCVYPRKNDVSMTYLPVHQRVRFFEKRFGHLGLEIEQYKTEQFLDPVSSYPQSVALNNEIYVTVGLHNGSGYDMVVKADNCLATPSSSPADPTYYQLIDHGCSASKSVRLFPSQQNEVKFGFRAFEFNANKSSIVYVHCEVSVCPIHDASCVPGCSTRHRRDVDVPRSSHLVSTGPFLLMAAEEGSIPWGTVFGFVCLAVAMAAVAVAAVGWTRKTPALGK